MSVKKPRKVILVELNEITWRFLDPFLKAGELPAFENLIRRGVRATTIAPEVPPDLDPWVSWMTLYTGRPASEHGVKFLEQPPDTVKGPKIWEIVADAGKSIGVFGSIMSWPPRTDIKGFVVPGPFSPGLETFPPELRPIQDLNVTYTRAHTPVGGDTTPKPGKLALLRGLRKLGLKTSTVLRVGAYLVRRALRLAKPWEAVSLQPIINYDLFEHLWRANQPDFATFHSNHVAHYQHRFWRSADPEPFLEKPSAKELAEFGGAIKFGYKIADELLGRLSSIVDSDTVIVVASGLGQQPYVVEEFRGGRSVVRMKDIRQVLRMIGVEDHCRPYSVMAPQWNIEFSNSTILTKAVEAFTSAYYGTPAQRLFACTEKGNTVCVNVYQKLPRPIDWDTPCVFPTTDKTIRMRDLCAEKDATPKQGYHDQNGVLIMAGPGVRAGNQLGECSTMDLAPTILALLGLPIPSDFAGGVLHEALEPLPDRFDKNVTVAGSRQSFASS